MWAMMILHMTQGWPLPTVRELVAVLCLLVVSTLTRLGNYPQNQGVPI